MNKEPNIYSFADECYVYYGDYKKDLQEKDKQLDKYKNVIDKIKKYIEEKVGTEIHDMMYIIDVSDILELLEGIE